MGIKPSCLSLSSTIRLKKTLLPLNSSGIVFRLCTLAALAAGGIVSSQRNAQAEGTFELKDGGASVANIVLEGIPKGADVMERERFTYLRVDILDPSREVIDIYSAVAPEDDIRVWCPDTIAADANFEDEPTPDARLDVTAGEGFLTSFDEARAVQILATRPRPPLTYALSGSRSTCGQAGVYTIRLNRNIVRYFDVRVRDQVSDELLNGRLFSYRWSLSSLNFNDPVTSRFYVLNLRDGESGLEGSKWKVGLNGLKAWGFHFFATPRGVGPDVYRSRSVNVNATPIPEWDGTLRSYLNDPALSFTPSSEVNLSGFKFDPDCTTSGGLFTFASQPGFDYSIFADLNRDGRYEQNELLRFGPTVAGTNTIEWNGVLPTGGSIQDDSLYAFRLVVRSNETHFHFVDVESADPGPRVILMSPAPTAVTAKNFWDDRDPSVPEVGQRLRTTVTSLPNGTARLHKWSDNLNYKDENIIDTWKLHDQKSLYDVVAFNCATRAAFDPALAFEADIVIDKTSEPAEYVPGEAISYRVRVTNKGLVPVNDLLILDQIPPRFKGAAWTCEVTSGVGTCSQANGAGDIESTISLSAGAVIEFNLTGSITPGAREDFVNRVTYVSPVNHVDPVRRNNSDSTRDPLLPKVDLKVTTLSSVTTAPVGGSVAFITRITNSGPSAAYGSFFTQTFPTALENVAWRCTATGALAACSTGEGTGAIGQFISVPPGTTVAFVSQGVVATAAGEEKNIANVAAPADADELVESDNVAEVILTTE